MQATKQPAPIQADEPLISLRAARQLVPEVDGKRPCDATVRVWAANGVRGVRLPVIRRGWRILTTERAVREFISAISEG